MKRTEKNNRTYYRTKNTYKDLREFADEKFVIFGISEDGSRASTYSNVSGINVIKELMDQRRKTIVIPYDKYKEFQKEFGYFLNNKSQSDPNFAKNADKYRVTIF